MHDATQDDTPRDDERAAHARDRGAAGRVGVAIVGCGQISRQYARDLVGYPELELVGVTDLDQERARALAREAGVAVYDDLEALLADERVQVVVNLTIHHAHHAVTVRCLDAGRHVFSEKPLALRYEEAAELVDLADGKGLLLASAPATFLGESQQTALSLLRGGATGTVRLVFAEVNWGRVEDYHLQPEAFYEVGALFDVGVYPLALVTAALGPARSVTAYGTVLKPDRVTGDGRPFTVTTPDLVVCLVELASGAVLRLTADFYVGHATTRQLGVEFHGDTGSVALGSWHDFDSSVGYADFGGTFRPVPLLREPYPDGVERGLGVRDLVAALTEGRRPRCDGRHAAHVVEILAAARTSYEGGGAVPVASTFEPPEPWDWALTAPVVPARA